MSTMPQRRQEAWHRQEIATSTSHAQVESPTISKLQQLRKYEHEPCICFSHLTNVWFKGQVASNTIGPRSLFTIFCAVLARHTFLKQKILKAQVGSTHTHTNSRCAHGQSFKKSASLTTFFFILNAVLARYPFLGAKNTECASGQHTHAHNNLSS